MFIIFILKETSSVLRLEELIKLKQLKKEGYLFIYFNRINSILTFYFRGDCYALHMENKY